ncbi:MAG: hypothetical protein HKL80_03460 [Acidimicrobiales bacterium]|nr:hypothetical protein [Acidimicrobiales bacterium]
MTNLRVGLYDLIVKGPTTLSEPSQRFMFGPTQGRGILAGWKLSQLLVVFGSALLALVLLNNFMPPANFFGCITVLSCGILSATVTINSRKPIDWIPVVFRWLLSKYSDRKEVRHFFDKLPVPSFLKSLIRHRYFPTSNFQDGHFPSGEPVMISGKRDLFGCKLLSGPFGAGVLYQPKSSIYICVIRLRGQSFALLSPSERDLKVQSYATLLSSIARSSSNLFRIQWIDRSYPEDGQDLANISMNDSIDHPQALNSYAELIKQMPQKITSHETVLALSIKETRSIRNTKSPKSRQEMCFSLLLDEATLVVKALERQGFPTDGILNFSAVSNLLARSYAQSPKGSIGWELSESFPWPMKTSSEWDHLRTDATFHSTYWISRWPLIPVGSDFLAPLVLGQGVRKTLSVVLEPIPLGHAVREVERAHTASLADERLRSKAGYLISAKSKRETSDVIQRENELAEGHLSYRFSGFVTVTAESKEQLEQEKGVIKHLGAKAFLELRELYGEQEQGFNATLPLCRGLS